MTCTTPRVHRWGEPELEQLREMVEQDSLFYWNGPQTKLLVERFRQHYPFDYVMPCSSGTAALHIAVAAAGIGPGDEVITTPITDMGTVIGILYQQGVPVFADLQPRTYNLCPDSVRRSITPRTKAVLAVHLAGNPCDLSPLRALCDEYGLVLIEDCAQAWGASYRGRPVGTIGHIGCYSLNDFKHISCGDGGLVGSNDERFGPRLQGFGDKGYARAEGSRAPDFLAPNYRISEPQAAVAAAQLPRMPEITRGYTRAGTELNRLLKDVPGILVPETRDTDVWTCWFYLFRLQPDCFACDAKTFAAALAAEGLSARAGYTGLPVYRYPAFLHHNFFNGRWPVKELGLTSMDYSRVRCPEAEAIIASSIHLAVNSACNAEWAQAAAATIEKVASYYRCSAATDPDPASEAE